MVDNIIMDQNKMGVVYHVFCPLEHGVDKKGVEDSKDKRKEAHHLFARTCIDERCWSQELMFGVLNLSMHKLLNNDAKESQIVVDQALKVASYDRYVKHCIKEYAALDFFDFPEGFETIKNGFDTIMLQVLDKCF